MHELLQHLVLNGQDIQTYLGIKELFNTGGQTKSQDDDDEDFEEPPNERALPHFLQNLPGVTATDSMGYRIEALRVYLER